MQDGKKSEINKIALSILAKILLFFAVGIFIISPPLQIIVRNIDQVGYEPWTYGLDNWLDNTHVLKMYHRMISYTHTFAHLTSTLLYIYALYYIITNRTEIRKNLKAWLGRLVPLFIFAAFAVYIYAVTKIRGANEYDLTGHPYMFESIYYYILYPTTYFFCAMLIWSAKSKKALLYLLIFSALPLNIMVLVGEWIKPVKYFIGAGVSAVFHNSNHYGYYLCLVIITAALMAVYEKNIPLRVISGISAAVATVCLNINNTLGAYLAVLFVFILFTVYCFKWDKKYRLAAVIVIAAYLLITFIMSFWYSNIMSSFTVLFVDLGKIAEDPLESDSAGSGRWRLWKGASKYIVKQPLLGYGVEGLLNTHYIGTPHNEFLQYAEFFGIPTALLYIAAAAVVLLRVFKNSTKVSKTCLICFFTAIGYLASSFFGVAIYYTTPFIYIFLGLAYSEYFHGIKADKTQTETE